MLSMKYMSDKKILLKVLFFLMLLTCGLPVSANCLGDQSSPKVYSFYVVPQYAATQVYTHWAPLLERVGKNAHQCFDLRILSSIAEFEEQLARGDADFSYMNPYHLVAARKLQGYEPLIADGKEKLFGILVVRKDSTVQNIKDLQGTKVAYPSPNAFGASLLIRSAFNNERVETTSVFVKTHTNVYRSVIIGDVRAGGGIYTTLESEPVEVRNQLRIVYETSKYRAHPIAAHRRVPQKERELFIQGLLSLQKESTGQVLLDDVLISRPTKVSYESDYKPIETLGLDKLAVPAGAN